MERHRGSGPEGSHELHEGLQDFASRLSHDVSAPIRTLRGFAQLLKRRAGPALKAEEQELLDLILADASRAERKLAASVDWLRWGLSAVSPAELEPKDRSSALRSAIDSCNSDLQSAGAQLHVEGSPLLPGTDDGWIRVFSELLHNSIQFRHPERTPQIAIRGGDGWFEIEDNGIGLPIGVDPNTAFALFSRLHAPSIGSEGALGVGLALCDRWIRSRGGTIMLLSRKKAGQGSGAATRIEWGSQI